MSKTTSITYKGVTNASPLGLLFQRLNPLHPKTAGAFGKAKRPPSQAKDATTPPPQCREIHPMSVWET